MNDDLTQPGSPRKSPSGGKEGALEDLALRRLRWRARRGLLENDLLIGSFLERHGDCLTPSAAQALEILLEQPEGDLLDLLLNRRRLPVALDSPAIRDMLARLQAA
jgi:antitoxin CptB